MKDMGTVALMSAHQFITMSSNSLKHVTGPEAHKQIKNKSDHKTAAGLYAGCRAETKPADSRIKAQGLIKTVVCILSHVPLWIIF